jgi:hypothetical protein
MNHQEAAAALGTQLLISGGLVFVLTLIHSLGLLAIGKFLHLEPDILKQRSFDLKGVVTLSGLGLMLFALHTLEIMMFAGFYRAIGIFAHLDDAIFFSASAYTTLGLTANFPDQWRLIGAAEALVGFVLIGWSTAFIIGTLEKLRS